MKTQEMMLLIAKATRIALRRPKQRVVVFPNSIIETTIPTNSKSAFPNVVKTLSSLEFGKDSEGNPILVEDMQFKASKVMLPLGQKSDFLFVTLVVVVDDLQHLFNVMCSSTHGSIEVTMVAG